MTFQPRTVHIRNFRSDRYRLREDLAVTIEEMGGQVVASSYDTGQYGYGPTAELAIEHLCAVLEDYYDLLREDRGRLSQRLESHLRYLDSVLIGHAITHISSRGFAFRPEGP